MSTKNSAHKTKNLSIFRLFLHCGIAGWCIEILYTALNMLQRREFQLKGTTSVWMFPIYGCAAFLRPLFRITHTLWLPFRGTLYALLIFSGEYLSGRLLNRENLEPWDYSRCRFRIGPHIRLDFFPFWFLIGLFYEKFTQKDGFRSL
ncbi:MAG: hypothetical protein HFI10_10620 [Lachnospiraceae bacterium]|jgi:uncharacterized membrane protein|nr:hypothetical protein [Lachnospiraceae bacterium]